MTDIVRWTEIENALPRSFDTDNTQCSGYFFCHIVSGTWHTPLNYLRSVSKGPAWFKLFSAHTRLVKRLLLSAWPSSPESKLWWDVFDNLHLLPTKVHRAALFNLDLVTSKRGNFAGMYAVYVSIWYSINLDYTAKRKGLYQLFHTYALSKLLITLSVLTVILNCQ